MIKRTIDKHKNFTIYTSLVNDEQIYITASVTDANVNSIHIYEEIYRMMLEIVARQKMSIVQERIFGSKILYGEIKTKRADLLLRSQFDSDLPFTYIQGNPCWGEGLAGVQMTAVSTSKPGEKVWTIFDNKIPCGRGWKRNGTTFLMLQNIYGISEGDGINFRQDQAGNMFDRADDILRQDSCSYKNVVRTWIYLDNILDWYKEFNMVRNTKYKKYGFIPNQSEKVKTEQIFLPASTGILASNPQNSAAVMDVLAVIPGSNTSLKVKQTSGVKQRSPFVYGSAFSRAMNIHEPDSTTLLLSGTASIDEQGRSVFEGDTRSQIIKTVEVVDALVGEDKAGATIKDVCTATVFLKRPEDYAIYQHTISDCGLTEIPAVCIVADVCRDELLFEIDATFVF